MLHDARSWAPEAATPQGDGRIFVFNRDLWGMRRRIEAATGLSASPGLMWPSPGSHAAVWGGRSGVVRRLAQRGGANVIHLEDAFIRSVHPGREALTIGLCADAGGWYGDPARSGRLHRLIDMRASDRRAERDGREVAEAIRRLRLSKYLMPGGPRPRLPRGAVIIADQAPGDAALGGAGRALFLGILRRALADHPMAPVLIRAHPAAQQGHLTPATLLRAARGDGVIAKALRAGRLGYVPMGAPAWTVFEGAAHVHVANSLFGLEALVYGAPVTCHADSFYAGRGLTTDLFHSDRQPASLNAVLAAAYLDHCTWFEPGGDRPVSFFDAAEALRRLANSGPPPTRPRPSRIGFLAAATLGAEP